ncbi:unnamed protein product, partial [Medioppia subpectinata]
MSGDSLSNVNSPWLTYEKIITTLNPGDLIEITRGTYSHWVMYHKQDMDDNYWCYHVTQFNDVAKIMYETLFNILGRSKEAMCRVNNQDVNAQKKNVKVRKSLQTTFDELASSAEKSQSVHYTVEKHQHIYEGLRAEQTSSSSSGIGREVALKLSSLGADVVITGLEEDGIHEVVNTCRTQYKRKAIGVFGDITDDQFVKSLVDTTIDEFSKIDILVNNAGICFKFESIENPEYMNIFDRIIRVNVRAMQMLTQLSVPYLVASNGCIVNTSSVNAIKPISAINSYCQSKSAVNMFTECLALELGPKGVRVNSV